MSDMPRSLFKVSTLIRPRRGFTGRFTPEFQEDDWPRERYRESAPRRKLPWIWKFIGYHLAAAFGIIVAFVAWLVISALTMH
jgi:hypothetical protein